MALRSVDPLLRDFVSLRDAMDRLFNESVVRPERFFGGAIGTRTMPLEVYETGDELVIRAVVPGVTADELDVQYQDGVLTLHAAVKSPGDHDDWTWHLREIPYGAFSRAITLPKAIDVSGAQAEFADGVLTLHLPKAAEAKPRQIPINTQQRIASGEQAEQTPVEQSA